MIGDKTPEYDASSSRDMLQYGNNNANLQFVVQVAPRYSDLFTTEKIIALQLKNLGVGHE